MRLPVVPLVRFSPANAKIEALNKVPALAPFLEGKRKVYSFDLLSGHTCPYAKICFSTVIEDKTGKRTIKDGKHTQFRCFSASQEVMFKNAYNLRAGNTEKLRGKTADQMYELLGEFLPQNAGIVRLHVGGDFFNAEYFQAWCRVAFVNPDVLFYAYTKSLPYWVDNQALVPANLILTASRGGRRDDLILTHGLREAVVVFSEQEAIDKGLEIDHTDEHAANPDTKNNSFALLIHGTQPEGSAASDAMKTLKVNGVKFSYSRK